MKDTGAVIVTNRARVQRAPINGNSARTFFVGLPGNVNYSFDPRLLGIRKVWNGPFVRIGGMMDGRGKNGEYGKNAKMWNNSVPYFSPYLQNGTLVDTVFKDSEPTGQFVTEALKKKDDFVQLVQAMKTEFLGLKTPKDSNPSFAYKIEGNEVEIRFTPTPKNKITASFNLQLKKEQSFSFPSANFKDIKVSQGKVDGNKWTIPAGDYKNVTFSATRKNTFRKVFTAGEKTTPSEKLQGQKLVWTKANEDGHKKAAMSKEYTLYNGKVPTDTYGRKQLFEPLGIEFLNKDVAFVTTRTAGVWKVVKGEWHLFSEGHYDSLGLIIESENSIVLGEKPGLVRLIDKDGDHWAEKRENVSDHFRFYGNYHEYLHGPIPYKGSYLYALNLTHNLPENYKAGGRFMGTGGGLKGWMCQVDAKGNFNTFASGFRSPAGLFIYHLKAKLFTRKIRANTLVLPKSLKFRKVSSTVTLRA